MESETKEFVQLVRLYAVKEKELPYGKNELNDSAKVVELSRQILKNQDREYIEMLLPVDEGSSQKQIQNVRRLQEDMTMRYYDAPDLKDGGNNAYRFINAVSDFATHAEPLRKTKNYRENMFSRTVDGNPLIDRAYQMVCA